MSWQPNSNWGMDLWNQSNPLSYTMGGAAPTGVAGNPSFSGSSFFNPNNTSFGLNANTLNFGLQGLQGLGNLWGAWQTNKLARDSFNFTKDFANRNLANQTQSYNTALEDRARSRAAVEGQTSAESQAYIDRNRLRG